MRHLLPVFLLLAGCPEPVATTDGAMSPPPGGGTDAIGTAPTPVSGSGAVEGGTMGGAPATAGGPAAGTFGAATPDAELDPKFEQEDIDDAWIVSGTTACSSCSGAILVRVMPPPPDQGGADEEIHLITRKSFDEPGEFEIKVPKRYSTVVLQVVDDANEDGKPSLSEAMGIPTSGPTTVAGNVSGIELTVGVFPDGQAVDGVGQTMDAPGATGAPMGDGATPPAGGPDGTPFAGGPDGAPPTGEEALPPGGEGSLPPEGGEMPPGAADGMGAPAGGEAMPAPEAPAEGG